MTFKKFSLVQRNVMGNSQKAYSHEINYCLRQKWAFLEAILYLSGHWGTIEETEAIIYPCAMKNIM